MIIAVDGESRYSDVNHDVSLSLTDLRCPSLVRMKE